MTDHQRIAIERKIARLTAEALVDAGFTVTVNDGEEDVVKDSTDVSAILDAMFSTGEDYLIVTFPYTGKLPGLRGWVRFIYGNDGYDVINDYTTSLEDVLAPLLDKIERMENQAS